MYGTYIGTCRTLYKTKHPWTRVVPSANHTSVNFSMFCCLECEVIDPGVCVGRVGACHHYVLESASSSSIGALTLCNSTAFWYVILPECTSLWEEASGGSCSTHSPLGEAAGHNVPLGDAAVRNPFWEKLQHILPCVRCCSTYCPLGEAALRTPL